MQTCKVVLHIYFKQYSIFENNYHHEYGNISNKTFNIQDNKKFTITIYTFSFSMSAVFIEDDEDLVGDIQNDDAHAGEDDDDMDVLECYFQNEVTLEVPSFPCYLP